MADPNEDVPFSMTLAGFVVPLITGLLSACCSFVILHLIFKSPEKLGTTYHRMMAIMSVFDIIASIFIAAGTIMMPSDNVYEFKGPMLGNHVTCQIQGFCIGFGMGGGAALYTCLSWYFVYRVAFRIKADKIKRSIEPIFYSYSLFVAIFIPSYYLSQDFISPIANDSFCIMAAYPSSCETWNDCIWNETNSVFSLKIVVIWVIVSLVLIVGAMIIIIWSAIDKGKKMKISTPQEQNSIAFEDNEEQDMRDKIKEHQYIRVLFIQALMYILAFLLTWCFVLVSALMDEPYMTTDVVKTVLFPMQGFWNLIIFVFDKVFLVRHTDGNENLWDAIKGVFLRPEDTPSILLTNIDEIVGGVTEESGDDIFRFGVLGPRSNGEEKSESIPNDVSSVGGIRSYESS